MMDSTIRNIDSQIYRELKAEAALEGVSIGELFNRAARDYLMRRRSRQRRRKLSEFPTVALPIGNEHLSEDIDAVLYDAED